MHLQMILRHCKGKVFKLFSFINRIINCHPCSVRDFLPYLPLSNRDAIPQQICDDPVDRQDEALDTIIPTSSNIAYDMKEVIGRVSQFCLLYLISTFLPSSLM